MWGFREREQWATRGIREFESSTQVFNIYRHMRFEKSLYISLHCIVYEIVQENPNSPSFEGWTIELYWNFSSRSSSGRYFCFHYSIRLLTEWKPSELYYNFLLLQFSIFLDKLFTFDGFRKFTEYTFLILLLFWKDELFLRNMRDQCMHCIDTDWKNEPPGAKLLQTIANFCWWCMNRAGPPV